jgi:hypothetical protein
MTLREVIARSYPTWDRAMADRMIAWLDHCGYAVVEKDPLPNEASLVPADKPATDHLHHH